MTEYRLYLVRCCTKVYTICQQSLNCIPHEDSASTIKNTNNLLHNLVVISWENRINELNKEHPNWRTERKINENKRVGETQPEDQTNFRFLKQEEKDNGIGKKKKKKNPWTQECHWIPWDNFKENYSLAKGNLSIAD